MIYYTQQAGKDKLPRYIWNKKSMTTWAVMQLAAGFNGIEYGSVRLQGKAVGCMTCLDINIL